MATYYVKTSGGNYSNDGLSPANAFDTIQLAADTVSAGDDVLLMVMANGEKFTNEPDGGLVISTTGGSTRITWSGTNSIAVVDGTIAIVDGTNMTGTDIIAVSGNRNHFRYISAEDRGSGDGWDISGGQNTLLRCGGKNCANGFNITGSTTNMMECVASDNSAVGFLNDTSVGHVYFACVAHNNITGFDLNHEGCIYFSLSYNNNSYGILDPYHVHSCTLNNNSLNIRIFISSVFVVISNCIMANGIRGISVISERPKFILNNAFYSNTADDDSGTNSIVKNSITVTSDPFTNAASGDFSLNNDPDGGQLCKQAGIPSQFPDTSVDINTKSFPDIGAVQTKLAAKFGG